MEGRLTTDVQVGSKSARGSQSSERTEVMRFHTFRERLSKLCFIYLKVGYYNLN